MSSSPDAAAPLPTRSPGLPTRVPQPRQGGRHRRPDSHELPEDAKPLVLAVPGSAMSAVADEVALLTRAHLPGLDLRPVVAQPGAPAEPAVAETAPDAPDAPEASAGSEDGGPAADDAGTGVPETARDRGTEGPAGGAEDAIVVPLMLGPDPDTHEAILRVAGGRALTAALGPHPLLAEALHERLSEAGLARADRARLFTIATAADGIVLGAYGGPQGVAAAEVTGVLLAARLALPVVTADLGDPATIRAAVERLRGMGAATIALAPYILGPELPEGVLEKIAEEAGCSAAAPLGPHAAVAKLVLYKYMETTDPGSGTAV